MSEPADRPKPSPVFHEKRTYRQRRLMDAARLAPILALLLWLLPLIWPQSGDARVSSAAALIYIFAVWAGVIVLTFGLSRALGSRMEDDPGSDP
ncbi:DUF6611 family protein [Marivita hallyeonensis]|uniref:Uncharacterized protein n=1 Tax=Marivita hallyeonensis TaxID=996342 RepID=A0A1M5WIM0_9RHOB|nr:hypothetical protein [Marivita hallyeonensis]SHH87248.1 hypothetical protein SAMN05443551_3487 [Marivita hallyeonensis]